MTVASDTTAFADSVSALTDPNTVGQSFPLEASLVPGGVNFSVYSRSASAVKLLLFDRVDDIRPARVISIDPITNRTYHYWHVLVPGLQAVNSTGSACMVPLILGTACGLIPARFCSILTAEA